MKEFVTLELKLVHTFVNLASTKYLMGNIAGGDVSHDNAKEAYRSAMHYFEKLSDLTSVDRRKLTGLLKKAKDAIAALSESRQRGMT